MTTHIAKLTKMYARARINEFYKPRFVIEPDRTTIEIDVDEKYFHAAMAIHGSVYFKVLDDAAYFAACVWEEEYFIVTSSFTTYITRPVSSGVLTSVGRVLDRTKTQIIVEAVATNGDGREVARANGIMVRSHIPLASVSAYSDR